MPVFNAPANRLPSGSAGAPAVASAADTTTGLLWPAAGRLGVTIQSGRAFDFGRTGGTGAFLEGATGGNQKFWLKDTGEFAMVPNAGNVGLLVGTLTNSANGAVQVLSHAAFTGGFAFGTEATGGETLWRQAASRIGTNGTLRSAVGFEFGSGASFLKLLGAGAIGPGSTDAGILSNVAGGDAALIALRFKGTGNPTGWGVPTGTLTRTTFDSGTVTLPQLAERVAALIADLHANNFFGGSAHGLLSA